MSDIQIVKLMPEEWLPYKELRLEALLMEPQAQRVDPPRPPGPDTQRPVTEPQTDN